MSTDIYPALVAFCAEITTPRKDKHVRVTQKGGGHYEYTYASLPSIIEHISPVLGKHGLAVIQPLTFSEGRLGIETIIIHTSGSRISFFHPMPEVPNAQDQGKLITYHRRYALSNVLGIFADDDDDANSLNEGNAEITDKPGKYDRNIVVKKVVDSLMAKDRDMVKTWVPPGSTKSEVETKLVNLCLSVVGRDEPSAEELYDIVKSKINSSIDERSQNV